MALTSLSKRLAAVEQRIGAETGWQLFDDEGRERETMAMLHEMGISTTAAEAASRGYSCIAEELGATMGYIGPDGFKQFQQVCKDAAAEYEGTHEWRWRRGANGHPVCEVRERR